jgi:Glycosyltransferase family 17
MIYLKTCFSAENEIKFLKLNLRESFKHIDKFIICEFNRTHTGAERELIFNKYSDFFTPEEKEKIIYIGADVSKKTKYSMKS